MKENEGENILSEIYSRRSERCRKHTVKMEEYIRDETEKNEEKFLRLYDKWKKEVRKCRNILKTLSSDENTLLDLGKQKDNISNLEKHIVNIGKKVSKENRLIVDKVDACIVISKEIIVLISEKIANIDPVEISDLRNL